VQDGIGSYGHTEFFSTCDFDAESSHVGIQDIFLGKLYDYDHENLLKDIQGLNLNAPWVTGSFDAASFPSLLHCGNTPSKGKPKKKKCSLCSSHSLLVSTPVMARYVQCGYVNYNLLTRHFCAKHAPPLSMVESGRLLDDRQVMELAHFRESSKKKRHCFNRK
jgi:hypothetical protein